MVTSTYQTQRRARGTSVDGGKKTEEEQSSQSRVKSECLCQGGQTGFKPRTVPPPQGPGGRCRGTYELGPSSSDA